MIDNQADYEQIFRAKARVPRSPSKQGIVPQPTIPSSASAGFNVQTSSTTEASSVATTAAVKPKSSQSVSPPPQVIPIHNKNTKQFILKKVDKLMPQIQMPNASVVPAEQVKK